MVRGVNAAGGHAFASDEPADIDRAAAVILPGVGAFEDAMAYMRQSGQADAIAGRIGAGVPFLGICLGLHLLFQRGAERSAGHRGNGEWVGGLSVLEGSVARLESSRLKVPHVGWDQAHLTEHGRRCPLFVDVPEGANVYFTHSYATTDDIDGGIVAATTHYACSFASGVWKDNVFGVQFHPEKSSHAGMRILSNFVNVARG